MDFDPQRGQSARSIDIVRFALSRIISLQAIARIIVLPAMLPALVLR